MLLQQIVGVLDKELDRLHALRTIVSSLESTFTVEFDEAKPLREGQNASPLATVPPPQEEVLPSATPTKRKRSSLSLKAPVRTAAARVSREAKEARALSSTIPAGPVVVMPAALARENAARRESHHQEPKPEKGSLGSMIRALHLDATA